MRLPLAGTAAVIATLLAAPAFAGTESEPIVCTVTGTAPSTVVVGLTPVQTRFDVKTSCGERYPVDWEVFSDQFQGSGASWLMLRNWDQPGGEKYTYVENSHGHFMIDPIHNGVTPGNAMAGPHPLGASAFVDVNGNGFEDFPTEPLTFGSGSFRLKRATTFDTFDVTTDNVLTGQKITVTGSLKRADWNTGRYDAFAGPVTLQFLRSGGTYWRDVKKVRADGGTATATVEAQRSGTYRYVYPGDELSGSAISRGDWLTVLPCVTR